MTRLEQIKQRAEKATKGPWRWMNRHVLIADYGSRPCVLIGQGGLKHIHHDSGLLVELTPSWPDPQFIAHAREDIPWLIEQNRAMESRLCFLVTELAALKAVGHEVPNENSV